MHFLNKSNTLILSISYRNNKSDKYMWKKKNTFVTHHSKRNEYDPQFFTRRFQCAVEVKQRYTFKRKINAYFTLGVNNDLTFHIYPQAILLLKSTPGS